MRFSKFLKILSIAFFILGCVFLVLQAIDNKNYDKEVTAVVTYVESHKSDDGRYTYNAHCTEIHKTQSETKMRQY